MGLSIQKAMINPNKAPIFGFIYLQLQMVGRKEEIKKVERLLRSDRSEFLAVTGRRRVGKTFLVDTLLRDRYCFSMTGIQNGDTAAQLVNFSVKLAEYDGTLEPKIVENWQFAFIRLKAYLQTLEKHQKQVLFIDELPWVATARSGFVQLLAHLWNDYLSKEKHFLLVICGSATSWITRKIINDSGGLHNRVTEIIHLKPFTLSETYDFVKSKRLRTTPQELARIYMALGGIPFYLEQLQRGESFATAIERICFAPNGTLYNEYNNLYQALFTNAQLHQRIINLLSQYPSGLSQKELIQQLDSTQKTAYQRILRELIVSDFVAEVLPFGRKKRGTVYRLIDEFSIFYHRFIKSNRKYTPGIWQQLANSQSYRIWSGFAFENLCYKHLQNIKAALGISSVYTEVSCLRVQGSADKGGFQVDLILDRKDNAINLCEMKFHNTTFTINKSYYHELLQKQQRFVEYTKTKKQVFLTFITTHGVLENDYANEIIDAEIRLEDLL